MERDQLGVFLEVIEVNIAVLMYESAFTNPDFNGTA